MTVRSFRTRRFEVERSLGQGGMGIVYEVWDAERGERVALKILHRNTAEDVRQLKAEFRALSDIAHPNLVSFHELFVEDQECFFTMELVEGRDLLEHVGTLESPGALREVFHELAVGVRALHGFGLLHRDLKPSNVRVARDGRVVILDFGLAKDYTVDGDESGQFAGTPAYMAPEQMKGGRATPATDWYAFGGVLYEALTGRPPFADARPWTMLTRKQSERPAPPVSGRFQRDADLEALALELLAASPAERPTGLDVVRRLRGEHPERAELSSGFRRARKLVDRKTELAELWDAFESTAAGARTVVIVSGEAGIGKTALVDHFLRGCQAERGAVVLSGRCHEREQLPYKAFDGIADALAGWMANLDPDERAALAASLPEALTTVFPVLAADAAEEAAAPPVLARTDRDFRREGFRAFRELIAQIRRERPVVLHADDVQWADDDSAALLDEILATQGAPPVLLVATHRDGSPTTSFLESLGAMSPRRVSLAPLGLEDARTLVTSYVESASDETAAVIDRIASDSGGSPLLLGQMGIYLAAAGAGASASAPISVAHAVRARAALLPEEARRLLEVVSLSGGPLPASALSAASGVDGTTQAIQLLERLSFVQRRPSASSEHPLVAMLHDRVGEAVASSIGAERSIQIHLGIARSLEALRHHDASAVARHFRLGLDLDSARRHTVIAADAAAATLAFRQAAELYRQALELGQEDAPDRRSLLRKLGDALVNAGHGRQAAVALRSAAAGAPPAEALDLRRRAAEQQLISGDIRGGLREIRRVLDEVGLEYPETFAGTLASLLFERARLALRGLDFERRPPSSLPPGLLLEVDACRAVAWPLSMVDLLKSALFDTRHLALALQAGDPRRVAIALISHATFVSTEGVRSRKKTAELLRRAEELVTAVNDPYSLALYDLLRALCMTHFSEWEAPLPSIRRAERVFTEQCQGVAWELDFARAMISRTLGELGSWGEQANRLAVWLGDADERGDDYFAATLRAFLGHYRWLAADEPARALAELAEAHGLFPRTEFNAQELALQFCTAEAHLYAGDPDLAHETARGLRDAFKRTLLRTHEVSNVMVRSIYAASALGLAKADRRRRSALLKEAAAEAGALGRMGSAYAESRALALSAGVARLRGRERAAADELARAVLEFEASGRKMHAAAARFEWGRLVGTGDGARSVADAERAMAAEGIVRPERVSRMLVPGFG
ncbi:MAG TPA: protein kinase [Polyangiaceae bacterium]|nr:protein kinase [Polyangiaceae bacterium]